MYVSDLRHTQAEVVLPEATSGGASRVGMELRVEGGDAGVENRC